MNHLGRAVIYTDYSEITYENIIEVLQKALPKHRMNAADIDYLHNYELGCQPLSRIKTYRPDINIESNDNVASEIIDFKLGFNWGNPISLIQRGTSKKEDLSEAIQELNDNYILADRDRVMLKLARDVEVCGVGYTYIDINIDYEEGESSYFTRDVLDPRCTFVVHSKAYPDKRVVLGVSYYKDIDEITHYSCFTKDRRYEIVAGKIINGAAINVDAEGNSWLHQERSGELNPLRKIPIIEWIRSYDRCGAFEKQIPEMNNLNLMISDFSNDVDQNTQAVWWTNDVDLKAVIEHDDGTSEEVDVTPKSGEWVHTFTSADGKTPMIQPLTINYDYEGMLSNILSKRALILQKCHVPQRNDNSGGSTGIAMGDATGWTDAETVAASQEMIVNGCVIEELKVVLRAIKESIAITDDNPMLQITIKDIECNVPKRKTIDLTVKVNAVCALLAKGFSLEDVLDIVPLAPDEAQVILRSGEGIKRYQETNVFGENSEVEEETGLQDPSDQEINSPSIGGMNTQEAVDIDKVENE